MCHGKMESSSVQEGVAGQGVDSLEGAGGVADEFDLKRTRAGAPRSSDPCVGQALHARPDLDQLIHLSDRGFQYVSIPYTERLADLEDVEFATLEWIDWSNSPRLLSSIGKHSPGRVRGDVLRSTRELDQGGRAQRNESPVSPGDST